MPKNQERKPGGRIYDWEKVQHDYITTPDMTLRKIADKYGINYKTVALRSKADSWFAARKNYQSEMVSKAIAKTSEKMAAELSEESDFLQLMKGHMNRMLSDQQQYQRHLITNPFTGDTEEKVCEKFDARAMKDSMQMLQMMEAMTRSLYNIQKAEQIQKAQFERERIELEKERIALERERNALRSQNMASEDDANYGVVLMPEVISNE